MSRIDNLGEVQGPLPFDGGNEGSFVSLEARMAREADMTRFDGNVDLPLGNRVFDHSDLAGRVQKIFRGI